MGTLVQKPLITEKSLFLAAKGWYTFIVDKEARKETIARDIAKLYKVTVVEVRTSAIHGKKRRAGKKMAAVKRPDSKKAYVQLKSGQKIDAFEVTSEKGTTT